MLLLPLYFTLIFFTSLDAWLDYHLAHRKKLAPPLHANYLSTEALLMRVARCNSLLDDSVLFVAPKSLLMVPPTSTRDHNLIGAALLSDTYYAPCN